MAKQPCVTCGVQPKRPGVQRCEECWLAKQPAVVREADADRRALYVPDSLRRARVPEADWPPGRRWCSGCQSFVRLADCGPKASRCRTCAGRTAHAGMLARTYMIHGRPFTADDYALLFEAQHGRCKICNERPVAKRLAVEHDHATGEVRGLTCAGEFGCNFAIIGNLERHREPGVVLARRTVEYLEKNWAHSVIRS